MMSELIVLIPMDKLCIIDVLKTVFLLLLIESFDLVNIAKTISRKDESLSTVLTV